jgi:phosphoribosylanthranilate isomerase
MTSSDPTRAPEPTRIKICGLCRLEDAVAAARAGADYLGFVLAPSPRRAPASLGPALDSALGAAGPKRVGVFVPQGTITPEDITKTAAEIAEQTQRFRLDLLQLHGSPPPALLAAIRARVDRPWIAALRAGADDPEPALAQSPYALLLDTPPPGGAGGGSGKTFDWGIAVPWRHRARLFLAGGLQAENVAQAIARVHPFAVDVASGVEDAPGVKDHAQLLAFIAAVRAADRDRRAGAAA